MKSLSLLLAFVFILSSMALHAQAFVDYKNISYTNIYLRDSTHVLARIDALIPSAGRVIVRFDGEAYPDANDRIILAANDEPGWQVNDGNVAVQSNNGLIGKSFSHTRTYTYAQDNLGLKPFYAVAQNYADKGGSGIGSIYGTLTVEFFPDSGPSASTGSTILFSGDITNTVVLSHQTIHASSNGKVIVRFDGSTYSDYGDLVVLAAGNTPNWLPNDGNVAVEAGANGYHLNSFSHTREYAAPEGYDYTYYALTQNYVETDGSGTAGVYGNLEVAFYPDAGPTIVSFKGFAESSVDLNDNLVQLTSISLNAPGPGVVLVALDGKLTSDPGDRIELGASDGLLLPDYDGKLTLEAIDLDLNRNCFAHSRVYTVGAGQHTYYALARTESSTQGSGIVDIFGGLTVKYFPNQNTAVPTVTDSKNEFIVYPNPTPGKIYISFYDGIRSDENVTLLDMDGHTLAITHQVGSADITMDLSSLPAGIYFVKSGNQIKKVIKF